MMIGNGKTVNGEQLRLRAYAAGALAKKSRARTSPA
jgi:hypothetical protein